MDVTRLRRLLQEVDEEHRDTLPTAVDHLAEVAYTARPASSRRSFLRGSFVVAGASALVAGPLAGAAAAADTTTSVAATTTTAPPKAPTSADSDLLAFAASLEVAAQQVYQQAISGGHLSATSVDVCTTFARHHDDHAHAISGLAGKAATGAANATVVKDFGGKAIRAGSEAEALAVAFDLENAVAATYAYALSVLQGTNPAVMLASIQSIEARHAVFLGIALGKSPNEYAIAFEPHTLASALDPAKNPIEG